MDEYGSNELLAFIERCPSAFHTVHEIAGRLEQAGFTYLPEAAHWELCAGSSYYTTRNG